MSFFCLWCLLASEHKKSKIEFQGLNSIRQFQIYFDKQKRNGEQMDLFNIRDKDDIVRTCLLSDVFQRLRFRFNPGVA